MFKIIVIGALIVFPICLGIWLLITMARHKGKMDAYDRIANTFRNLHDDEA